MNRKISGRFTIGLYNTYDTKTFREAHRRVIARASSLAEAFDWNLALFGFPLPSDLETPNCIADWISSTTTIGEEGKYMVELARAGRMMIFSFPRKGFPPQLGKLIIATRKPWKERSIGVIEIAKKSIAGESIIVLFGLGPHGLPSDLFEIAELHFDVTQRGKSLETCTAIGAVVGSISTAIRELTNQRK